MLRRQYLNQLARRCCSLRLFSSTSSASADFTHIIIGAGVVGLATAHALLTHPHTSTPPSVLLLERHSTHGTETSSRNSEVIHAGIYYPPTSLKTQLCIRGRGLLYDFCARHDVPHRKCGKWIVAQDPAGREALEGVAARAQLVGVPMRWVGAQEAERGEPEVAAGAGVLESPETGIVDSHALMTALLGEIEERGGELAVTSDVVGVEALERGQKGWRVRVKDAATGEVGEVSGQTLVNAAGLAAVNIHNLIVGGESERVLRIYYAKGNYFSYGASHPTVQRLIYPAPVAGHGGLGTHLTLDMAGRIRFGPDVEWVNSPDDLAVNMSRLGGAVREIKRYLPSIDESALAPDYTGIRPKLAKEGAAGEGKGFQDFVVRKEEGYEGWINLLGIESPGLTSSLAIGERVASLLYR